MKQLKKKTRKKRDRFDILCDKRDRALDRVAKLWCESEPSNEGSEELNTALDVLTLAHAAATFEFVSGT